MNKNILLIVHWWQINLTLIVFNKFKKLKNQKFMINKLKILINHRLIIKEWILKKIKIFKQEIKFMAIIKEGYLKM